MPRPEPKLAPRYRLRGFILPFVAVQVFAIMAATAALIGTVTALSRSARAEERRFLDTLSLEAGTQVAAFDLASGTPRPFAPFAEPSLAFNGRQVAVTVSPPEGKLDLNADSPETIAAAMTKAGVSPRLVERVRTALADAQAGAGAGRPRFVIFAEFAGRAALTPDEEDCLRRSLTVGRWPNGYFEAGAPQARPGKAGGRVLRPGDQVDLRAAIAARVSSRSLWSRLRLTGEVEHPVSAHDQIALVVHPGAACPYPIAAGAA